MVFKPTKFKIIFIILGIIAELYSLTTCYVIDGGGCYKFFYYISIPFVTFLERIGDSNVILMLTVSVILFSIIFYALAIILEFLYESVKKKIE